MMIDQELIKFEFWSSCRFSNDYLIDPQNCDNSVTSKLNGPGLGFQVIIHTNLANVFDLSIFNIKSVLLVTIVSGVHLGYDIVGIKSSIIG